MMTIDHSQAVRKARSRRGISMIEMVVLMAGVATMLGICAVLLQLLMKLDADSRARLTGATASARLAEQFRRDVHVAQTAKVVEAPAAGKGHAGLRLEPGGGATIEYQVQGNGLIQRLESRKGSGLRRERYEIPHSGAVALAVQQENGRSFATIAVDREVTTGGLNPPRAFEVTALLGKNKDKVSPAAGPAGAKP